MNNTICGAINQRRIVRFYYEGELRVVEPHCHGITTAGNQGLRAFQTEGYSSSGTMGWKMFDLGKATGIELSGSFKGSRSGYKKNDQGMSKIYCQL